ncbi:TPA: phage tail tape measure protein [Staphylococcus aureus]
MGERIKGLSIGLDLDAANLNRSFAEIKRNFKTLNSDLKLTGNNFKYTEKSTHSYKQRIKELDGTITGYKKNVDDLAKQYGKVSQEQGENSAEAQKLRQEYNKQANELNFLEKELEKTTTEFEEFKKAQVEAQRMAESGWGKTSKVFESMGPKLTKMGDGLKSIGKGLMIGVTAPVLGIAAASGKAFAEVDKGLDTVTQATGATGGELKKLQNSFKDVYGNFPADAETVGGVLGEVNTRLGFTGKELESATESFLKFSHITGSEGVQAVQLITRAMGDAGIEADEYQSVLDMVAKAAQASGISVDTLADSITKYGAPMRAMGFEMKESIALFSQWEKSGVNTEIAFSGLKKAISNWGKAGKNPREEFKKTLAEIEKTPDIASATSLAIEAFGAKAGPDLADAIKGGRFSYQEFLKTIEDSQGTVNQTFKDSESGSERFKVAMNKLKLVGADVWTSIESAFAPVMEELIKKLSIAVDWFSNLSDGSKRSIVMILKGVVQLIWNLIQLWFVGKILGVVRYFGGLLKGLIAGIWDVIKSIFSKSLSAIWNATKSIFGFLFNSVKSIFTNMKNWLSNTWSSIRTNTIGKAQSLFSGVKSKFTNLWNATKEIFSNLRNWMSNIWNSIKDNTVGIASRLWSKVRGIFTNMRDGLQSIISKIKSHIGGMVDAIKKGLNKLIDGLNWVGGKLGMDKIPKLHTGTEHTHTTTRLVKNGKIARDTFATVGDKGRGNGPNGFRNEMIEFPNGKRVITPNTDTTAYLPKGSKVYNGAQTYSMLNGTLPRFSLGTMWKDIKSGASSAFNWTKDQIGKGTKWLGDKVGDVLDFIENPGKLLNYILEAFGIDFNSLTKGMGIAGDITKAAWSKIKKSATDWIKENLEAMGGGDLVGGILDPDKINYHYGRTAAYTAATGRPFHEGVDFPFVYQEVRTPMGGRLTRMPFMSGGYGNYVKITSGVIDMLFAHLKNFSKSPPSGTMVKPGDVVGLTGNTGFSTGPHLHFEMRRNGRHFNPEPYLRNAKKKGRLSIGGGDATSGSGATYASRVIRQAQSILGGRYKGKWIHDQMMRVAKRESNYQSNAVNNWDINAQRGDPSRGLFQIIGSTFRANAKRGYTNYNNPVHQGISAMQYIVRRYGWGGFKRAGDYAYATGGKVFDGWYNLGEDGHPEWIIPTDPARRNDAMKILHYAAAEVRGKKASKNKRPSQLSDLNEFDDPSLLLKMIEQQQQQIALLLKIAQSNDVIADKDYQPIIDEYAFDKKVNASIEKRERQESTKVKFRKGGIAIQ